MTEQEKDIKDDYTESTLASKYAKLEAKRTNVVNRCRDYAELTIPALLPRNGFTESSELPTPYQSVGVRGVNNLASKLLLALLPPNSPYFKLNIDRKTVKEMLAEDPNIQIELDLATMGMEKTIVEETEQQGFRNPFFMGLKYLIVTGNALLYLPDDGGLIVYKLDQYVVQRDPKGNAIHIILKETVNPATLPVDIRQHITDNLKREKPELEMCETTVDLYTEIELNEEGTKYYVVQEVDGEPIPESEGQYDLDDCPFIAARWSAIANEDYGRGLVEEYVGDLRSLEALTKSIVEGSAAAAKVVFMNNPNGVTKTSSLAKAKNGDIIVGNSSDVTTLQVQKFNDFRVALETATKIEQRLSQAFLLMSSVQRDAERVTAEEIKLLANELESTLGGVYSLLSQEVQLPMLKRVISQLKEKKKLPSLPKNKIIPTITTGIENLNRNETLNKIDELMKTFPPEFIQAEVDMRNLFKKKATLLGLDIEGVLKSDEAKTKEAEAMQAQQKQAQGMDMMKSAAGPMINQIGSMAKDNPEMMQQAMQQMQGQTQMGATANG